MQRMRVLKLFPINLTTWIFLSVIGTFFAAALALRLGWMWRVPLLFVAISFPALLLWAYVQAGNGPGLVHTLVVGSAILAIGLGSACGAVFRRLDVPTYVLGIGAVAAAAFVVWDQYIPDACLGKPLRVRVAGSLLVIPIEMRPRVANGNSSQIYGLIDRKSQYARLCRKGRNGIRRVDVDTVSISPASSYKAMTARCDGDHPPAWCKAYSPTAYRHIDQVLIAPASRLGFPRPYWGSEASKYDRQGDLVEGSICLKSNVTQCWIWVPYGDGSRLIVSTNNLDKTFIDMPVEEARELILKARDTTLGIISR